jgi:hypothetical protein
MDFFSLTHLIVVPTGNSIPTTGSTQDLTAGQVGVFGPDYAPATSGDVATDPYVYIAQGRAEKSLPSLRSDKIAPNKIIQWSRVTGSDTYSNQIVEISDFKAQCNEDLAVTVRLDSFYLRTAFYNGLTRSFVVKTPCCECGGDPCTDVDNEALIDLIIAKAGEDFQTHRESVNLNEYLTFEKIGTGDDAVLRISTKDTVEYAPLTSDPFTNTFQWDQTTFKAFVTVGPDSMTDFITEDRCDIAATITTIQEATYKRLTSAEVKQLEYDYYSYKVDRFKQLYRNTGYNPYFESYVSDGTVYNQYLVKFHQYDQNRAWNEEDVQDEQVLLYVPADDTSGLVTILAAAFGEPIEDTAGAVVTTTSTTTTTDTTTTTETTTTTTTTLQP